MKTTLAVIAACALLGGASVAYAQAPGGYGEGGSMSTGRASAYDNSNNNEPGTMAGTPTHSVPANSANTGMTNLFNSARRAPDGE